VSLVASGTVERSDHTLHLKALMGASLVGANATPSFRSNRQRSTYGRVSSRLSSDDLCYAGTMSAPNKPWFALLAYARALLAEADLADRRAETLAQAALKMQTEGDVNRAEAMWFTCRKIRVQALLDRGRGAAAAAKAATEAGRRTK
jgi:hypothetical protein